MPPPSFDCCNQKSPGFWGNVNKSEERWAPTGLSPDGFDVVTCVSNIEMINKSSQGGNAWATLSQQLMGAILNVSVFTTETCGAVPALVNDTIAEATALLQSYCPAAFIAANSDDGQTALELASILSSFNHACPA